LAIMSVLPCGAVQIPTKPAGDSDLKPATLSM
jgi:hypothetical protein